MKNYQVAKITNEPRVELKEALNLTGCEVSINELPANVGVPFVHAHKQNEELYIILDGDGELFIDGEMLKVSKGDTLRIDPEGKRCFRAGKSGIKMMCIQSKKGSLEQYTMSDGVMVTDIKPSWL
ncbi:cupin domain-containing protein [Campylobacter concisus]|jgi:cupin domain protein|uniref:cupin domain-containing protein n=1 Tax=Campylobacter concisus TaxID=199 RepID=UPI000CD9485E|nr:cupin domain-containing protein [Campylobacter concisus]QPH88163.1 cupin domain-containing protein [Campylobacter concisus]